MEHAVPVLRVVSVALVLMSFSAVLLNAVIGTGNTRINLMIEIFAVILYSTYVYLVMEHMHLSITWGWGSEWLYWTSIFTLSFLYLKSGKWRINNIR